MFSYRTLRNDYDAQEYKSHSFTTSVLDLSSSKDKKVIIELIFFGLILFGGKDVREKHYQHFQRWNYTFALVIADSMKLEYAQLQPFRKFQVLKY